MRFSSNMAASSVPRRTHDVLNQSKPLMNYNMYDIDPALQRAMTAFLPANRLDAASKHLSTIGKEYGSNRMDELAILAEKNGPKLRQFDNYGRRVDVIDYNPAYHALKKRGIEIGGAAYGYNNENNVGSHVERAAIMYMMNQLEPGHCCPIVMTAAAIPVLKNKPAFEEWYKKLLVQEYDPENKPIQEKKGVVLGMSMTEKQGGSDVRANTTIAKAISHKGEGMGYLLTGHKWFTSAPMSDAFLTLAKTENNDAPSCFLVPRWKPDGSRNDGFNIMRLKDKLADRSNASSEVEYDNAYGLLVGNEGKGVKTIIEMVQSTRLDCTIGAASSSRKALGLALNHSLHRSAFGKQLIHQPLMANLLADLCIEAEAHTLLAMRIASAYDEYNRSGNNDDELDLFRIGVSIAKYYVCKRQPTFAYECMEIFGGNGFVEDFPLAKLFRQSPLNSIWEGSGNVIALDILRGLNAMPAVLRELSLVKGMDTSFDLFVGNLNKSVMDIRNSASNNINNQHLARNLCDRLALGLQASLMMRYGHPKAAAAYIASRIGITGKGFEHGAYYCNPSSSEENAGNMTTSGFNYGSFVYSNTVAEDIINDNIKTM